MHHIIIIPMSEKPVKKTMISEKELRISIRLVYLVFCSLWLFKQCIFFVVSLFNKKKCRPAYRSATMMIIILTLVQHHQTLW